MYDICSKLTIKTPEPRHDGFHHYVLWAAIITYPKVKGNFFEKDGKGFYFLTTASKFR